MPRTTLHEAAGEGVLVEITNDGEGYMDVLYASVTAPEIVRIEVYVGDDLHDVVYAGAGGSHSWWMNAGGKLLDHNGLDPGQTLTITTSGKCALRLDWVE